MANQSAREMLSRLPVRMAAGGDPALYAGSEWAAGLESAAMKAARESGMSQEDYYANLLKAEERILGEIAEDPSSWDAGKAYNAIIESGVSIKDALDAGVKQSTIDAIFASGAPLTAAQLGGGDSAFGAGGRLADINRAEYASGAKRILADFMADDYLSPEERRYAQQVATVQGLTLSDIASVGVDPNILFNIPTKEEPVPPVIVDPEVPVVVNPFPQTQPEYVPPTVYQPLPDNTSVFAPGEESLDRAFRDSPPRTEVTDQYGNLVGFDYTPAASLISATGSGFSWTPPTVTGRPRSLMSTGTLGRYTQGRAAQDLRQLVGGNEEAYRAFEPLLSQTGSYGGGLSRSQLFGLMQQQADQRGQQEAANYQQFGTRFGARPAGTTGYSEIAEEVPMYAEDMRGVNVSTGSLNDPMTVKPIDFRYGRPYAEGGEVKKLKGFADGGPADLTPEELQAQLVALDSPSSAAVREPNTEDQAARTESRSMLDRLNTTFSENISKPVVGSLLDMTVGLGDLGQMGVKYLANKAGIETKPFVPVSQRLQQSAGVAGYDPYSPAAVATQILPFARGQQAVTASGEMLQRLFPNLGRETAAYGGSEIAAAGAREIAPDSMAAELLASTVGNIGADIGSTAATRRMADDIEPPDLPETESARMLDEVEQAAAPAPARLSRDENAIINERVGTSRNRRKEAKAEAQRVKSNYSPAEGWAPIEVTGLKYKNNKPKVEFKKIPYGFQNPPTGMERDAWRQQLANGVVGEVEDVVRRAQQGDQAALDILAQANWYRGMRDQLRSEFGGIGDVFADVLGTTSAQTNVEQNFKNAVEILRRYSRGDYDNELAAYQRRIDQGLPVDGQTLTRLHKEGEFPLITKAGGELFNTNSPSSMGALLDMFRSVKTGSSPKTPNFTGNLIGLTNEATIDVWAARMLRRMSEQPRIPPAAEQGVSGSHLVGSSLYEPRVGGEFGFGQDVFRDAANRINSSGMIRSVSPELGDLGPDDLQAVAWFIEKERWTNNGWTTKAGEGGSLEYEMSLAGAPNQARIDELRRSINQGFKAPARRKTETDEEYEGRIAVARRIFDDNRDQMQAELSIMEAPLQRYQLGISGERPNQPMSNYAQAELAAPIDDAVRNDQSVTTYNIANSYGSFMGDTERSLNAEFVVRQDFNPERLRRSLIEQGKAYDQDAVFMSRVVSADTPNARPGVEIYFKESITPAQMAKVTERLREKGVDGFTYVTDMRFDDRINRQTRSGDPETAALTGLRFQYVPEFDDAFDPARSSEIYAEQADLFRDVVADTIADGNVSDARMTYYDTEVYFRDDYDDYLTRSAPEGNPEARGELATGADDSQSNRSGEGAPEPPEPVRDGGGQAATNKRGKVTFAAFGGSLGDARQKLGITPEKIKQFKDSSQGVKQTRVPEVEDAAKKLNAGEISTQEYLQTVEKFQPITPLNTVQKRPTNEEIAMALTKNEADSAGIVGVNLDIPEGTMISSRLDIPAYESNDTWVVTLHDGSIKQGLAVGYGQTAVLNGVEFVSNPNHAVKIAAGDSNKGTIARINGSWENRDPDDVEKLAKDILNGTAPDADQWTEVGMNPFRHSYFYRKSDGMPVANAEQVIQIGPLVLAKKVKTRPVESPEHEIKTPKGARYFKHGGNVERMTNDNRKYI